MKLTLSDVEHHIVDGARRFSRAEFGRGQLRELVGGARPDAGYWKAAAGQGWFSLAVPEDRGGAGFGVVAATLVHREVGWALLPGPLLWGHLAARFLPPAVAAEVIDGSVVVTGALLRESGPVFVEDADLARRVMLVGPDGLSLVDVERLPLDTVASLDPTRTLARLTGPVTGGELVAGPDVAGRLRIEGACLTAAQAAGGAARAAEIAVEYAKERQQFGRPIGSFQSVKHLCVDLALASEAADAAVAWAALHIDELGHDAARAKVAAAKIVAGTGFLSAARGAVQVLGAMGYTWDHDTQLYLKRAHALDVAFGDHLDHATALAAEITDPFPAKELR